ncbi:MAG: Hpt domain-containing protein [Lachnospiraceae bacterium]|nr:Hpt domain-containing protein [Lachnospiraceae bacterium]
MKLQEIAQFIDLDLKRIDVLFMGKEELYKKFLRKFPENVKGLLVELEEAVEKNNHEKIEACAHAIKGVASNLGVDKVTEFGTALMLDIRNNTPENINEHYKVLVEETEKAITYIEQLD